MPGMAIFLLFNVLANWPAVIGKPWNHGIAKAAQILSGIESLALNHWH
jgi:hypothetical protein